MLFLLLLLLLPVVLGDQLLKTLCLLDQIPLNTFLSQFHLGQFPLHAPQNLRVRLQVLNRFFSLGFVHLGLLGQPLQVFLELGVFRLGLLRLLDRLEGVALTLVVFLFDGLQACVQRLQQSILAGALVLELGKRLLLRVER